MGSAAKFRAASDVAKRASDQAAQVGHHARAALVHVNALAASLGREVVYEPAGEGQSRVRYRRRLPRWLAWVRRLGVGR